MNGKINQSKCYARKFLEKLAAEGSLDAQIELAAITIEDEIDVEKNMTFLKNLAEKGNIRALIDLGFVYVSMTFSDNADDAEHEKSQKIADSYFLKAAELGSAWGMCIFGAKKWLVTWMGGRMGKEIQGI